MKTSIKLKVNAKKLKELSQAQAQQVGGGTSDGGEPQQAQAAACPTIYSCAC
ncbi:hypothetical protein [Pseudoalteromonas byunsanensis]|uniref:hypothetical protein n=1 Tax=Pseudoalteromonas byunsanensis TaxID=327939 RepID=UPI00158648C9|nr:hypothetical protein [Pseudoalteromonas byunsanensis]